MTTVTMTQKAGIARITLNRPEVHNAFNEILIAELQSALRDAEADSSVRAVVLAGEGKSFCAGADLQWMQKQKDFSYEENLGDALELSKLLETLYSLGKPTLARVQGAAIGGGTGLVAACDIAIASERARFSLSEVKLGLVPACISPYVLKKLGESAAREYFLTGERIGAEKAREIGLVREVVGPEELDSAIERRLELLATSGPAALRVCKELLDRVPQQNLAEANRYTAEVIAKLRVSEEGQEGMAAFFEKRKPNWVEPGEGLNG